MGAYLSGLMQSTACGVGAGRRLICCDEPIFGPLLDSDVALSGTSFRLPHGMLGAGCALSFVLAHPDPLENEDISRDTVSRALARYAHWRATCCQHGKPGAQRSQLAVRRLLRVVPDASTKLRSC